MQNSIKFGDPVAAKQQAFEAKHLREIIQHPDFVIAQVNSIILILGQHKIFDAYCLQRRYLLLTTRVPAISSNDTLNLEPPQRQLPVTYGIDETYGIRYDIKI